MENSTTTKYILTINEMVDGIPFHTPAQMFDTEEEAIKVMRVKINYEMSNYLELNEWEKWDYEMAKKNNIDVAIGLYEASIKFNDTKKENYIYFYIDKVEI